MRFVAPLLARAASFCAAICFARSSRMSTTMPLGPRWESSFRLGGVGDRWRFAAPPGAPRPSIGRPSAGAPLAPPRGAPPVADSLLSSLLEDFLPAFLLAFFSFLAAFFIAFFSFFSAFLTFFISFLSTFCCFCFMRAAIRGFAIIESLAACSWRRIWNSGSSLSFRSMSSFVLVALFRKIDPATVSWSFLTSSRSWSAWEPTAMFIFSPSVFWTEAALCSYIQSRRSACGLSTKPAAACSFFSADVSPSACSSLLRSAIGADASGRRRSRSALKARAAGRRPRLRQPADRPSARALRVSRRAP
mmetsp:Transcript_10318/g.30637  ORF Transcript_10318/g.30637 Transcript_10318/m.30637 type:complete len:304 (-) Transcript_10318:1-912(-)